MIELTAEFDCIGHFTNLDGKDKESKRAHYVIGKTVGKPKQITGGLYLPKEIPFPKEGILIKIERKEKK